MRILTSYVWMFAVLKQELNGTQITFPIILLCSIHLFSFTHWGLCDIVVDERGCLNLSPIFFVKLFLCCC